MKIQAEITDFRNINTFIFGSCIGSHDSVVMFHYRIYKLYKWGFATLHTVIILGQINLHLEFCSSKPEEERLMHHDIIEKA